MNKLMVLCFYILFVTGLTGCESIGKYLEKGQDAKRSASEIETTASIRQACSGNYDVIVEKFAHNQQLWDSFNRICYPNGLPVARPPGKPPKQPGS